MARCWVLVVLMGVLLGCLGFREEGGLVLMPVLALVPVVEEGVVLVEGVGRLDSFMSFCGV
jgi:hypothetical protein